MTRASPYCCMSPTCTDADCEGRQVARLHQAEGGLRHTTDFTELLPAEPVSRPAPPVLARLLTLRFALIVVAAVLTAAAQIFKG